MVVMIDDAIALLRREGFVQSIRVKDKEYTRNSLSDLLALRETYAAIASAEGGGPFANAVVPLRRVR